MNGLLIIDKPVRLTSHEVVSRVRRILGTKRVGHTGTLDPFATGVMVILVGQATRLAQFLDKDEKEYEAVIQFGFETDTGDRTGVPTTEHTLPSEEIQSRVETVNWDEVFESFRGEIEQKPPMFSAKKVDGKKLYEHARKGESIERQAVAVTIKKLELINSAMAGPQSQLRIRVVCSAGTYIRTLAEDIGRKIGIGAHVAELRRTRAGRFTIGQSSTLEELEKRDDARSALIPMNEAVSHLAVVGLADDRIEKTKNGLSTQLGEVTFKNAEAVRMQDGAGNLIAIGFYDDEENTIRPKVVLV